MSKGRKGSWWRRCWYKNKKKTTSRNDASVERAREEREREREREIKGEKERTLNVRASAETCVMRARCRLQGTWTLRSSELWAPRAWLSRNPSLSVPLSRKKREHLYGGQKETTYLTRGTAASSPLCERSIVPRVCLVNVSFRLVTCVSFLQQENFGENRIAAIIYCSTANDTVESGCFSKCGCLRFHNVRCN